MAGDKRSGIRGELNVAHVRADEKCRALLRFQVPDPRHAVPRRGGEGQAVRAARDGERPGIGDVDGHQVQPGAGVPQTDPPSRTDHKPVGPPAEACGPRIAVVSDDVQQARAGRRVPQLHAAVKRPRQDAAAVRTDVNMPRDDAGPAERRQLVAGRDLPCAGAAVCGLANHPRAVCAQAQSEEWPDVRPLLDGRAAFCV